MSYNLRVLSYECREALLDCLLIFRQMIVVTPTFRDTDLEKAARDLALSRYQGFTRVY